MPTNQHTLWNMTIADGMLRGTEGSMGNREDEETEERSSPFPRE